MSRAVMQQALEALEQLWLLGDRAGVIANPAIDALKRALAEPAEPVMWRNLDRKCVTNHQHTVDLWKQEGAEVEPLYTSAPTPRKPEPLTKAQATAILDMALDLEKTGRIVSLSEGQERTDFVMRNRNIECALRDYLRSLTGEAAPTPRKPEPAVMAFNNDGGLADPGAYDRGVVAGLRQAAAICADREDMLADEIKSEIEEAIASGEALAEPEQEQEPVAFIGTDAAITALKQALAEPEQEPAFHGFMSTGGTQVDLCFSPSTPRSDGTYATAYYTAPTPRKPDPLTDEDVKKVWDSGMKYAPGEMRVLAFARAIEKAHGIKDQEQ